MKDLALYRPILKRSWEITTKFKSLWFFGLFVAALGSTGEYEIITRAIASNSPFEQSLIGQTLYGLKMGFSKGLSGGGHFFQNLWAVMINNPGSLIAVCLVMILTLAITAFFIWLGVVAQIGLIKNVDLLNKNKKVTINEGIDFGVNNFWPTFFANIGLKVILFILFWLLSWAVSALVGGILGLVWYYILFALFAVIILIASFLVKYQIFFILLKKQPFFTALISAWQLFTDNLLISLEMAFVLFVFHTLAALINVLLVIAFMALPFVLTYYFAWPFFLGIIVGIIGFIAIMLLILTITASLMTFIWASWTSLFDRLTDGGGISKIMRGSMKISEYFNNR